MRPTQILPPSATSLNWEVDMDHEFLMPVLAAEANMFEVGVESSINTPVIADEIFAAELFKETVNANDQTELTTGHGNITITKQQPDMEMELIEPDFTETIWGATSFDCADFGLCAPASLVEGAVIEDPKEITPDNDVLDMDNVDLLKWIIDDQEIDDHTEDITNDAVGDSRKTSAAERVSVIVKADPLDTSLETSLVVNVKMENMSEDEKYRKMREQNNEASRKCRMNRKRKLQEAEDELNTLTERNLLLKANLETLEKQVKKFKAMVLANISA